MHSGKSKVNSHDEILHLQFRIFGKTQARGYSFSNTPKVIKNTPIVIKNTPKVILNTLGVLHFSVGVEGEECRANKVKEPI
jgi:hypothetical protein